MPLPLHTQSFTFGGREILLLVPDPATIQAGFREGGLPLPYWSQVWPAALALTEFLSCNTALVERKTVLELAAGLGLPSLFAASIADRVVCSDYLEDATWFMAASAKLNGLTNIEARVIDWRHLPPHLEAEVVLLSDVNYEPAAFPVLHKVLEDLLRRGCTAILSTPQRLAGKAFIEPLLEHCRQSEVVNVEVGGSDVPISIFVLKMD